MSNTKLRVISALILLVILSIFISFGPVGFKTLLLLVGLLFNDELINRMLKVQRTHFGYVISQLSFLIFFSLFSFIDTSSSYHIEFIKMAMLINSGLLCFLFFEKKSSRYTVTILKTCAFMLGFLTIFPFLCFTAVASLVEWDKYLFLLLVLTFAVDTGAWFVGRNFGKNKLWPSISPKKTWEGAVGGSLLATIIASTLSFILFDKISLLIGLSFVVLTVLAQLGDLVESKLKRQLEIKDSSNLIPGHGGIYDRIDSLIFVTPFFVFMVKYLY